MQVLQHLVSIDQQDIEAPPASFVSERLGEMALANAAGAAQQHVVFAADVVTAGELQDVLAVNGRIEAKVEVLQCFLGVEVGAAQP